ncbi:internal head protein [Vibrio phage USC-1]|uniref:Uncharacterized protein n=2 Tax=Aphroditevirus USC1 TaxID=2846605 RepID=A0A514A2J7_9CAUD|nr:internal head protein [Vibrio phage USC-1]QCW23249.1 hypothetical protein [Vibrio phage 5 TSL-2019]QDH47479.1 hypothetical protein [Vibrio phage USC-1]
MTLSIKNILALHAGVESLETPPVDMPAEEVAELTNELEHRQMRAEIRENTKEIDDTAEVIEEVQDQVEELEEVVEGMEALAAQPTLNRPAIAVLYRRAERINAKLGAEARQQIAGNESLASDDAFRAAVIDGCEGFMETAKKVYETTSSFIKNIFYALVDAVKKLFSFATDQSAKAESMKKELKDKEIKSEVKLGGWNRFFEGNLSVLDTVMTKVGDIVPEFGGLLKDMSDITSVTESDTASLLNKVEALSAKFEGVIKGDTIPWDIIGGRGKQKTARGTSDKNLIYWSVPGKGMFTPDTVDKAIAEFSFDVATVNYTNIVDGTTLTGTSKAMFGKGDLDGILNSVIKNAEMIKKLKASVEGLKSTVDGIVSKLKQGPKEGSDEKATKVFISALKRLVTKHSQLVNNFCRIVSSIDGAKLQAVKAHF